MTGLAEIHQALRLNPTSLPSHQFQSLYWSRKERFDLSLQSILTGLRTNPQAAALHVELGRILALEGDMAAATEAYRRAAELEPLDSTYQRLVVEFSLGYNYLVQDLALPAARFALKLAPDDARNLDSLAQVYIRLGDLEEAGILLERAKALDPQDASTMLHFGYLLALRGDFNGALEHYRLVQRLAPNSALAEQAERLIEGMLQ